MKIVSKQSLERLEGHEIALFSSESTLFGEKFHRSENQNSLIGKVDSRRVVKVRKSRGFTLVELMVTITIVIILASIAFVVGAKAKKKALQAKAMVPIREVAAANAQFATENHGRINTLRWDGDKEEGKPFVGNSFWGRLQPYLFPDLDPKDQKKLKKGMNDGLDRLFSSADANKMTGTWLEGSKIYHDSSGLPVPFAFNDELYTWNNWENMRKIGGLADIMYITYGFGLFNEADGKTATPRPTDGSKPDNNIYFQEDGRALVAFLDGHVEFMQAPIPTRRFKR